MICFRNIGYLGRLGNQMFQFASSIGIARRKGYDVFFPIENCSRFVGGGPVNPKTGSLMNVKCDILDCFEVPEGYFKSSVEINPKMVYHEGDFKFNPQVMSIPPDTDLYGYFQDERYFRDIKEEILSCFEFRKEHSERSKSYWEEVINPLLEGKSPVSLHVRRGDYTVYPDHHPTCSKEYYSTAIDKLGRDDHKFLVFSDDIEWCSQEFSGAEFIIVNSGSPYVDLKIMTDCDHHIIANSSYSWWGAWLDQKENKRVFAPSRWFGPAINKDSSEIYCEGWEVI
jgi:hypothetical protein